MRLIYTPQAKSFLTTDIRIYGRIPGQIIPYMVRASGVVRQVPYERRGAAMKVLREQPYQAWAEIHRELRPYFFTDLGTVTDALQKQGESPIELPDLESMPHIHPSLHYLFDMIEDLDRMTALLLQEPESEDVDDRVKQCWQGMARIPTRLDGLAKRLLSGKAFNNK
jgi:hypothetical protein